MIKALIKINKGVTVILFSFLFIMTLMQVFFRYIMAKPLYWSEEIIRYAFIWLCYLGVSIVIANNSQMTISLLFDRVKPGVQRVLRFLILCIMIFVEVVVIVEGFKLAFSSMNIPSIALQIPWTFIYLSAPVGFITLLIINGHELYTEIILSLRGPK